ncbi:MAG TPA: PD-(D/E)XK nuclease family protein [Acidimicrobiia bacterium]
MTPDEVRNLLFREKTRRDKQASVGPSELGGCSRRVWHRLNRTPTTNPDTLSLAANFGTAFHSWIEERLAGDPRWLLETRIEREGIRGHIDCYDTETETVIDWKTTKMRSLPYFPSQQQRWQVHVYGWLMSSERPVRDVCLVAFPKDGTDRDIKVHQEPYNPKFAEDALAWLADIRAREAPPRPEKKRSYCRDYCNYYDPSAVVGCPGI